MKRPMQAVGIALHSSVSALGNNPTTQELARLLCSDEMLFRRDESLLARPILVGAFGGKRVDWTVLDNVEKRLHSENLRLAITALDHIEKPLAQMTAGLPKARLAVVLGTSTSGMSDNQALLKSQMTNNQTPHLPYDRQAMNALAVGVGQYLGFGGLCYTISTACSSSGKALATGQRLLNANLADIVVVGGVDTLCPLTLNGFDSLESLSAGVCQPCGANRDGINIGEAGAVFVLTKEKSSVMLVGAGESMDAWHISAPHPDGKGAYQAMSEALTNAGLTIQDIDYINMHGTATPQNDSMEIKAINHLFGDRPLISSTKHKTGHCLGASSAIEASICTHILSSDELWLPHHHNGVLDESLPPMNYVKADSVIDKVDYVLSNSFAFGGSNVSLIFKRSAS